MSRYLRIQLHYHINLMQFSWFGRPNSIGNCIMSGPEFLSASIKVLCNIYWLALWIRQSQEGVVQLLYENNHQYDPWSILMAWPRMKSILIKFSGSRWWIKRYHWISRDAQRSSNPHPGQQTRPPSSLPTLSDCRQITTSLIQVFIFKLLSTMNTAETGDYSSTVATF